MTMIDVDTSPLQAAREWRGIGLVAAARTSGLPMAQAEALEEGDTAAFGSVDEMIAAAIVYGASIGIGRDEAVALLDRTVGVSTLVASVPAPSSDLAARPASTFSGAVQERSARIASRASEVVSVGASGTTHGADLAEHPALNAGIDVPIEPAARMPEVPTGPTPEQAIAASGELELDAFGFEAPWDRGGQTGELQAWAMDLDHGTGTHAAVRTAPGGLHGLLERFVGGERSASLTARCAGVSQRMSELARAGRERMRRSEHATLLVAIGGGAVLIALVVALGGAFAGSDTPAGPGPVKRVEVNAEPAVPAGVAAAAVAAAGATAADAASEQAEPVAKTGAPLPPARIKVDVYNAGSVKGKAKQVAATLETAGYRIGEVTNAKSKYSGAAIIYPSDMQREAKVIARRTGVSTLQEAPGSSRSIIIVVA